MVHFSFTEIPAPTIEEIGGRSVTINVDDPPELDGEPQRNITQYAVTLTPQDGGPPIIAYLPAEAGNYTIDGLSPETMYDALVEPVIDTDGQGEEPFDIGIEPLTFETGR